MPLGAGSGTLTTSYQKVAEAGEPVTLLCGVAMIMSNSLTASGTTEWTWPANLPYPTDGAIDVFAKVATGTAAFQRAKS